MDNVEQLLNSITDPNTGEPVVVGGQFVLVCAKSLEKTALNIRNALDVTIAVGGFATSGTLQQPRVPNPVAGLFDVVSTRFVAPRLATDTSWFFGDPRIAFRYMENWPMSVVQAPANSEMEFTRDVSMRWKGSERGVYATTEPRAMAKSTA